MNKQKLLKVLNPLLALDFLCLFLTVALRSVLSPELYSVIHPILGFLLFFLAAFHVYLNWAWVRSNLLSRK